MRTREENITWCREVWRARQDRKRWIRESNAVERAKRSPQEQLARLDALLGIGVGAVKERKRLRALLVA
jgi:hypothetical protein